MVGAEKERSIVGHSGPRGWVCSTGSGAVAAVVGDVMQGSWWNAPPQRAADTVNMGPTGPAQQCRGWNSAVHAV